jgi:hypothetical protein
VCPVNDYISSKFVRKIESGVAYWSLEYCSPLESIDVARVLRLDIRSFLVRMMFWLVFRSILGTFKGDTGDRVDWIHIRRYPLAASLY